MNIRTVPWFISRCANRLTGGQFKHSISGQSYAHYMDFEYRLIGKDRHRYMLRMIRIDTLFKDDDHCRNAYHYEIRKRGL